MEESRNFKVVILSRETIKPSSPSPTPDNHGSFKLSLIDQLTGQFYVPTLFFYKATGENADNERSERLKSSLSETLTRFYPFAGRCKDHLSISCNDEGVEYSEAQVLNCSLSDVLEKPNPVELVRFMPNESPDLTTRPMLLVQASFFECGGMALGTKFCHKIADASTIASFINGWASSALGNPNLVIPDFSASTLFPPTNSLPRTKQIVPVQKWRGLRATRLLFGPSELSALQAGATRTDCLGRLPTRFEAVSAFLWKIVLEAKKDPKPSALTWPVNLRPRGQPPLPGYCFGNLAAHTVHEGEVYGKDLPSLAEHLRHGTLDVCNNFVETVRSGDKGLPWIWELRRSAGDLWAKAGAGTLELYALSSWCKFPLYEADFGWGKPVWVTTGGLTPTPNVLMLIDTRDGLGIEAWVSLMEEHMTCFESNRELRKYASINPSAYPS